MMEKPASVPRREIKRSLGYIAIIVSTIAVSSLLLTTQYWFVWPVIIVLMLVFVGYFTASKNRYQCPCCNKPFRITALQDFLAPHGITKGENGEIYEWKLLKCQGCTKRQKCYRVEKD